MVLHWGKILCYTKSCDYATLKAEMVQYLGSRLRRGGLHEKQRKCSISAVGCAGN